MIRRLLLLATLMVCMVGGAFAAPQVGDRWIVGDLVYLVTKLTPELEVEVYLLKNTSFSGDLTIPDKVSHDGADYAVTGIDHEAFIGSDLNSVKLPEGCTSIEKKAFENCGSLESVEFPEGLTSIGVRAFERCNSLKEVNLPAGLTNLEEGVFNHCTALKSIYLPPKITSVKDGTFYDCEALESITLPEGLTSIGAQAFERCYALNSVSIPSTIEGIGADSFDYCNALTSIYLYSTTYPEISSPGFNNKLKIYVPTGTPTTFGSTDKWKPYEGQIVTRDVFTVSFNLEGGELNGEGTIDDVKRFSGLSIQNPGAPSRQGYEFVEWQLDGEKYNFGEPINKSITLKAKWLEICKVSFDLQGGELNGKTEVDAQTILEGSKAVRPDGTPTKQGYEFLEWQLDGESRAMSSWSGS